MVPVTTATTPSIAIIGAGITGLTAAYRLHERGLKVKVLERAPQAGGAIRSIRENGYLIEAGPNSLQLGANEVRQLIKDVGLESSLLTAGTVAKKRFIARGGGFMPVPMSPGSFFATNLFSFRTKCAIFAELLSRPRIRANDIDLAEFVRSHFTQELVDYALNPLIAGIYAGDPAKLSVKHAFPTLWEAERLHGSLLRGMMKNAKDKKARGEPGVAPIVSFQDGLQALPDALRAKLPPGSVEFNAVVETIIPGRPHRLIWKQAGQTNTGEFDQVLLAVPAAALAQLAFGSLAERPLALLESIPQPPVSSLFLGYKREQVGHPLDGFGGLVPAVEHRSVLGILFSTSLFPGRAPDGHVGLTVFAGGMRQPDTARLPTDELLARIARDLKDLVGVTTPPAFVKHTFWPRAIPQYVLGYERFLEAINQLELAHNGLFVGGNVRDGISLQDCVKAGEKLARRTAEFRSK
jgi:oxygen-dependent protoporphyrinogen oxidase